MLKLQLFYCCLGMGYNLVSYVKVASGGRQLSSTSPITGAIFMGAYGVILLVGYKGLCRAYQGLMAIMLLMIFYNGIIHHFIVYAQNPDVYASWLSCAMAITINFFGSILNLLAAIGHFESDPEN